MNDPVQYPSPLEQLREYTDPKHPRMTIEQAEDVVRILGDLNVIAGDNLGLFGEEVYRAGRHRVAQDSTDIIGLFLVDHAERLAAEIRRIKRMYR